MTAVRLADLTWPEVAVLASSATLVVPVGSTEQHGPHLPFSTDTDIAVALGERLAECRGGVVLAPAVPYGSSGEHAGFPGTLSIGQEATELLVLELGRSACATFPRVLLVSAHGGNAAPVARALARLQHEGRDVVMFAPRWDGELHAGHTETSLQFVIDPDRVHCDRVEVGNVQPLHEIEAALRTSGVRAVSGNGVLGDPRGASVADGIALLDRLTADLVAYYDAWLGVPV